MNKSCPKHSTRSGVPLFPSKSTYLLNKNILAHPCSLKSAYLLDQSFLAHPLFIEFYVPTRQKYSSAPSSFQSPRTYSTKLFKRTLFLSNSTYLLDKDILVHACSLNSAYLLDQNVLVAPPLSTKFYVPTRQKYSSAPISFKVYVPTRQNFSSAPSFDQILRTYPTKITSENF